MVVVAVASETVFSPTAYKRDGSPAYPPKEAENELVKVTSSAQAQKNYEDSTTLVAGRYEAGVNTATWQLEALAGQKVYEEKMRMAEILARRAKNISKVSDSEWRKATIDKGRNVIGARMKAAAPKQQANWAPYRSALEALTLPDRTADGMANFLNRGGAVVKAMMDTKAAQG